MTLLNSLLSPVGGSAGGSNIVTVREVTAAGAVTVSATTDYVVLINKTVGAATTVNLPAGQTGLSFVIKDKKLDANSHNITITPNGSQTIDGAATLVLNVNGQSTSLVFQGTDWSIV